MTFLRGARADGFWGASISVNGVIMQTFHTGTLHEQGSHVRGVCVCEGGFSKSNKDLCFAEV